MVTITFPVITVEPSDGARTPDQAELAAVAFLARYSGRTLDAYRHDLRNLFQWAADHGLAVLEATRAHLEMYRSSMEERGPAASTIDRRLSTRLRFLPLRAHRRANRIQPGPIRTPSDRAPDGASRSGSW